MLVPLLATLALASAGPRRYTASPVPPPGRVLFHEDWSYTAAASAAIRLGTGPTEGVWTECFDDTGAWVLAAGSPVPSDASRFAPAAAPTTWDAPSMACLPGTEGTRGSLWLPFGRHGLNRVKHSFAQPWPARGTVECVIGVRGPRNLRERGVILILETPRGDASISFGLWAGTGSPSYRITGIRCGQRGYDDLLYHQVDGIRLPAARRPTGEPGFVWQAFGIDVGSSTPGRLIFRYRELGGERQVSAPLDLLCGKDYTSIKAVVIGSLPHARFTGSAATGDHEVFVEDVWFVGPPD